METTINQNIIYMFKLIYYLRFPRLILRPNNLLACSSNFPILQLYLQSGNIEQPKNKPKRPFLFSKSPLFFLESKELQDGHSSPTSCFTEYFNNLILFFQWVIALLMSSIEYSYQKITGYERAHICFLSECFVYLMTFLQLGIVSFSYLRSLMCHRYLTSTQKQKPPHELTYSGSKSGFCLRLVNSSHETFTGLNLPHLTTKYNAR